MQSEIQEPPTSTPVVELQFGGAILRVTIGAEVKAEQVNPRNRLTRVWPRGCLLAPTQAGGFHSRPDWALPAGMTWGSVFENVPEDLLATFARFTSHQWPLLEHAHNHPPFLDVFRSNPVLAYALACNDELKETTPEFAARRAVGYAQRKQRDIVGLLGFPATETTVKLLKRIMPEALNPSLLRLLRASLPLEAKTSKILSHVDELNMGVLAFIIHAPLRGLLTPKLIGELLACEAERLKAPTADILLDTLRMGLGIRGWAGVPALQSCRQVRALHDRTLLEHLANQERIRQEQEVWREYQKELARHQQVERDRATVRKIRRTRDAVFPTPPIPGTKYIAPITSEADLVLEGLTQKNCVASYASDVLAGDVYIYRVLEPARATLSVVPGHKGMWFLKELKLKANKKASKGLHEIVHQWLALQAKQRGPAREWDDTPF